MKKALCLAALLSLPAALAAPVTLTLNGQPTTLNTTVIGGKTYILLDDLKKGLAGTGGANQRSSVEGCLNEWLFNGVWRMRVTKVESRLDGTTPTYSVTAEVRNGTTQTLTPQENGIIYTGVASLTLKDGDQRSYDWGMNYQQKTYGPLLQGSGFVFTFNYRPGGKTLEQLQTNSPTKFLMEVKNTLARDTKARYTVPDPSFRVNLTCTK